MKKGTQTTIVHTDAQVKEVFKLGNGKEDPEWAYIGCRVTIIGKSRNFPLYECSNAEGEKGWFWKQQLDIDGL